MRRAARVDANHAEIRETYRRLGCSVADTFTLGKGFPDLVVAKFGITDLVEVKDGSKPASARKLTDDEIKFHNAWFAKVWIIKSVEDVLAHVEDIKRRFDGNEILQA
jgi:hypothetical protein